MPVPERSHNPDDEPFDYVAGYDRMWQAQHDATQALVRIVGQRDDALAEVERLREAIREHHAQILMGARDDHDLNQADEALWRSVVDITPASPPTDNA
jgi:hypothetical protein